VKKKLLAEHLYQKPSKVHDEIESIPNIKNPNFLLPLLLKAPDLSCAPCLNSFQLLLPTPLPFTSIDPFI
jgi:hypothetical protein